MFQMASNSDGNRHQERDTNNESLTGSFSQMQLDDNFLKTSLQTMDDKFREDWKDPEPEKRGFYMPERKRPNVEKVGDTAELRVLKLFEKLPEFLGESVFLLEGKLVIYQKLELSS